MSACSARRSRPSGSAGSTSCRIGTSCISDMRRCSTASNRQMLLFDPWLLPWFAESSVPSLWGALLPKPAAVFLTHDHDDHVDPRTLLHLPKETPIIVPSRRNRKKLHYDYLGLLREMGFGRVVELAHGESWDFDGGAVVSVPFYGEDPCDLEMPRNCYLIHDRGQNILVHADSGPTNNGRSALKEQIHSATGREIRTDLARTGLAATTAGDSELCRPCLAVPSRELAGRG